MTFSAVRRLSIHEPPKVLESRPVHREDVLETSSKIFAIVLRNSLKKFSHTMDRLSLGIPEFLTVISKFVESGQTVQMCLPAFPFKSANKVEKALGTLPDKAEEVALRLLNQMCEDISKVYKPGAHLTIISDGLMYNDLLTIPDRDVWAYGQAIRAMASNKGFVHISFTRLKDLVPLKLPPKLDEITYVANATNFRRQVLNKFGDENLDIDQEIATNADTLMTYRGYCRFLESDLRYLYPLSSTRSHRAYRANVKFLAKQLLIRGQAFAGAVKAAYPNHLRLSIHVSTGEHKVSIGLLPTDTSYTTPWHCAVGFYSDGRLTSGLKIEFDADPSWELVYEDGRPSFYQQKPS